MQPTVNQLKTELTALIHQLHTRGHSPATSTNYSFRLPDRKSFFISASGIDKALFREEDFLEVDENGIPLSDDSPRPSAETPLHSLIYRFFPEVSCILHSHSLTATLISKLYPKVFRLSDYELLKGMRGINSHHEVIEIPVFTNSQDMSALGLHVADHLRSNPRALAFLLSGHGLYTWGSTIPEAKRHLEVFEFVGACELQLRYVQNYHPKRA
ncbi:MAG: methylthioribulose 1-phosphate dehydratase [Candidatus Caenarcaniphilales bacterium]|nr:methylthioribulose 1-phosphate dehydratase [Candidatus Caenarcaniphilales bacterium]